MQRNLTRTWLNAYQREHGGTRADAIRWLNFAADIHCTSSRLNQWLREDREPDRETRIVMLKSCLPFMIRASNSKLSIQELSESLT